MGMGRQPVFDEGQFEVIFKKLRKPDAQTIHNTVMEMQSSLQKVWELFRKRIIKEKSDTDLFDIGIKPNNTDMTYITFYCLHCKEFSKHRPLGRCFL